VDVSPSGGGNIEVDETAPSSYPATSTFTSGASVRLEAVPASGYRFDSWSGDLSGTTNPTVITIDCNKKVTAKFSQIIMHTLTMQVKGSGSTSPAVGVQSYEEGTTVSVTATSGTGWQFDSWTGDVADPHSATTVLITDSDKTVIANFSKVKPSWWLISGIIAAVIVIGVTIWLVIRTRAS